MPPPPPPAPAPPPPPMCFPFKSNSRPKPRDSLRDSDSDLTRSSSRTSRRSSQGSRPPSKQLVRTGSFSPTATLTSAVDKLTFDSDSENYDVPPPRKGGATLVRSNTNTSPPKLLRSNTKTSQRANDLHRSDTQNTKKSLASRFGYGWGIGRSKEKGRAWDNDKEIRRQSSDTRIMPHPTISRHSSRSSNSKNSRRPSNESNATLVSSAYERKEGYVEPVMTTVDTTERVQGLRNLMLKDSLDYYVVLSEDAHQSEYVADSDKRRQWISGFTGSAGQAVVSKTSAYLITDSRYWVQAQEQTDSNWHLIPAGDVGGPKDWVEWIVDRAKDSRIGVDARMISHEMATLLTSKLNGRSSKLIFPSQNLVDILWKDRPLRSKDRIIVQGQEFAGKDATEKLREVRDWIKAQPPATLSYSKAPPTPSQMHVGTLITSLSNIAWLLNLRGTDIPYNPLFQSYLFVGLSKVVLFADAVKITDDVAGYLQSIGVDRREYNDVWTYLRRREWGEGKVLISPQTSYAISLMLTHFRYTIAPSYVEDLKSIKNEVELDGMRRAYLRDGVAFVKFLGWLDHKISQGYEITEWEAAFELDEFRKENKHFMGLAYENISAAGPNAALPHYSPTKGTAAVIDRESPYLNDSGGQYRDGTCDTTRTVHFGRPTPEQCEAYTRVLQGHIAIDSAVFPEGTSGQQLDVLARRALWKDGLNYMHGTGHGFGSYLNVHEGPHGFSSRVPLVPGHVITNEPGFYKAGEWGMRIESSLAVKRVSTRGDFNGDIWLGFERLTCVPIQTRMVKESMLSKEEKQWLKDHNKRCREKLEPLLKGDSKNDKRALKWLVRESERSIGIVGPGPGGISIDWD